MEITDKITINLEFYLKNTIPGLYGYVTVSTLNEEVIIESDTKEYGNNMLDNLTCGLNKYKLEIPNNILAIGQYIVYLNFSSSFLIEFYVDSPKEVLKFTVVDNLTTRNVNRISKTSFIFNWEKTNNGNTIKKTICDINI